jgi:hypothetical protein
VYVAFLKCSEIREINIFYIALADFAQCHSSLAQTRGEFNWNDMRESSIETYLIEQVKLFGGDCQKHVSPGRSGVVDRIVIMPLGLPVWFVETKRPDNDLQPLQRYERDRLLELGQRYTVLDTKAAIDSWVAFRKQEIARHAAVVTEAARTVARKWMGPLA